MKLFYNLRNVYRGIRDYYNRNKSRELGDYNIKTLKSIIPEETKIYQNSIIDYNYQHAHRGILGINIDLMRSLYFKDSFVFIQFGGERDENFKYRNGFDICDIKDITNFVNKPKLINIPLIQNKVYSQKDYNKYWGGFCEDIIYKEKQLVPNEGIEFRQLNNYYELYRHIPNTTKYLKLILTN